MMHYTFFLFGLCTALDESTTTAVPPVQDPDCHGCSTYCTGLDGCWGCAKCMTGFGKKEVKNHGMVVGTCVPECTCPNGTPAPLGDCKKVGQIQCSACDNSHWLDDSGICQLKQCTCKGGKGARGANCPYVNGQPIEKCVACGVTKTIPPQRLILDTDTFLCKLPNGKKCTRNGQCFSGSCAPGEGQTNRCQCQSGCEYLPGTVVTKTRVTSQENCVTYCSGKGFPFETADVYTYYENTARGADNCLCLNRDSTPSPNSGASSGEIKRKTCTCLNGDKAKGVCAEANREQCTKCNPGYELQSDHTCQPRLCQCLAGIPSELKQCPVDGAFKCKTCFQGFHIATNLALSESGPVKQTLCIKNQCKCSNGVAATGLQCPVNGESMCVDKCEPGYTLLNNTCILNQCSCYFGTASTGLKCPAHGDEFCASCIKNYHLQLDNNDDPTGRCIKNTEEDVLV